MKVSSYQIAGGVIVGSVVWVGSGLVSGWRDALVVGVVGSVAYVLGYWVSLEHNRTNEPKEGLTRKDAH